MGAFNFLANSQTALNTALTLRAQQRTNKILAAGQTKGYADGWIDGQLDLELKLKTNELDLATATTTVDHLSTVKYPNEYMQGWADGQRKMVQWLNER